MPSRDHGVRITAVDRTDAVQSRLEQYFEKSSGENIFFDARGVFKRGPAAVIRKAFVAGLHPPEFNVKAESKLDMNGHWKDKPVDLVREVVIEWRTVELTDK